MGVDGADPADFERLTRMSGVEAGTAARSGWGDPERYIRKANVLDAHALDPAGSLFVFEGAAMLEDRWIYVSLAYRQTVTTGEWGRLLREGGGTSTGWWFAIALWLQQRDGTGSRPGRNTIGLVLAPQHFPEVL